MSSRNKCNPHISKIPKRPNCVLNKREKTVLLEILKLPVCLGNFICSPVCVVGDYIAKRIMDHATTPLNSPLRDYGNAKHVIEHYQQCISITQQLWRKSETNYRNSNALTITFLSGLSTVGLDSSYDTRSTTDDLWR